MREIKFRVWDNVDKKFITGIPPKEYMLDPDSSWDHRDCDPDGDPRWYPMHIFKNNFNGRIVFQQYIGLKDIFEGDIISVDGEGIYEIKYERGTFGFYMSEFEFEPLMNVDECVLKVLGNIFENPDLLK